MRYPASLLTAALALGGCAFDDGQPFGRLDPSATVAFEPPTFRLDREGRLRTAESYAVEIDQLSVTFDALVVRMAGAGSGEEFDPANPPEGFSLCHNGHCHSADGRLVDYEDVALEAAGATGGFSVALPVQSGALPVMAAPTEIPLASCDAGSCDLQRGELSVAELVVSEIHLRGRVFDQLTGGSQRLPDAGVAIDRVLPMSATIATAVAARVDSGRRVGLRLALSLDVSAKIFDDVDFENYEILAAAETVAQRLTRESVLEAEVSRFDP